MAIYHFSAKVISRAAGSSAVAASAYRSASWIEDERLGRAHDFTNKAGVIHSEVMLPEGAPGRWTDRATLWNEVEAREGRKDAQLAREVEVSIPREMSREDGVRLVREFVQREFVDRGMVADLNVHWDHAPDGSPKPHAHVMLSMREVTRDRVDGVGFGKKVREWNATSELQGWRERWGEHVNGRLAELGIEAQIDHRSLKDQGIDLEPQHKIGPAGMRREGRGEEAERADEHREIARRNGEKIIAEPSVALDAITRQQSTFTDHDLARFVHRHTDDKDQFDRAMRAVKASPELVALGVDGRGRERFSTREMLETERRAGAGGRDDGGGPWPQGLGGDAGARPGRRRARWADAGGRAAFSAGAHNPARRAFHDGRLRWHGQVGDAGGGAGGLGGVGLPGARGGPVGDRGGEPGGRLRHSLAGRSPRWSTPGDRGATSSLRATCW